MVSATVEGVIDGYAGSIRIATADGSCSAGFCTRRRDSPKTGWRCVLAYLFLYSHLRSCSAWIRWAGELPRRLD